MSLRSLIGIGLRTPHFQQILREKPLNVGWIEVHSENFLDQGSPAFCTLMAIREHYPISLHGVGLSLGSETILSDYVLRLKKLVDRLEPFLISEHLSWGRIGKVYIPDLLPVPYTAESLDIFCRNVDKTQKILKRRILIENPSSYIEYKVTQQKEVEFLINICKSTGSKILLDVNNVFVSCFNHSWDAKEYLDALPTNLIQEIHIAGHSIKNISSDSTLCVDTHDRSVCPEVWELYRYAICKFGNMPTLLEWDECIPSLDTLITEAMKALDYMNLDKKIYVSS